MEILSTVWAFSQHWILGPILWFGKIIAELTYFHKVYTFFKRLVKRFSDPDPTLEQKQEPVSPIQVPRKKTYVKTVGKDTTDYTPRVSATGLRADNPSDVREALRGVDTLETIGMQGGSARTVEATGIDLRARQTRPGEGNSEGSSNFSEGGSTFKVTGIKGGKVKNVTSVGIRF